MPEPDAYNVFRRKQHPALRCAVREDRPIPSFLQGEMWDFGGTVRITEAVPAGFRLAAAERATEEIGYYLFHALDG